MVMLLVVFVCGRQHGGLVDLLDMPAKEV